MSKNFDKIIAFSDILIENDGGTINIDLTNEEKKRIIKKIKNYNFDKDTIRIEEDSDKIINDLNYNKDEDDSFSFEIFTTYQEKVINKNLINVLSLLKIDNFNYQNKNSDNLKLYLSIQKENNNDIIAKYYRIWIMYLGQENAILDTIFNNNGLFRSRYNLEELIFKNYNLIYNNTEIQSSLISIIRYLINLIIYKIKYNSLIAPNDIVTLSLSVLVIPIVIYYLIKISKIFNNIFYNFLKKIFNYLQKDETDGLNKTQKKKIFLGSLFFLTYYNFKSILNRSILTSFEMNLAESIFPRKFNNSKKESIINFYEQIEILEIVIKKIKQQKNLVKIIDDLSLFRNREINFYNKIIIKILKEEIRNYNEYDFPCHSIVKKIIKKQVYLPVYFFIDKNGNIRSKIDCLCCLLHNIMVVDKVNIFLSNDFQNIGDYSDIKKTYKNNNI